MQFMPQFDLAHCLGTRQKFASMDRDLNADENVPQRSIHLRRRRDLPQTSTLPMVAENHEFGNPGIFMDPSFIAKAMEQSTIENGSSLKPPKFLVEKSNHQPHHCTVSILLCPLLILILQCSLFMSLFSNSATFFFETQNELSFFYLMFLLILISTALLCCGETLGCPACSI